MAQFKKGSRGNTPKAQCLMEIEQRLKVSPMTARRYFEGIGKPSQEVKVKAFVEKVKIKYF